MSSHSLHSSLLRPPILHILRAAGFHSTRPAALDTLVDLASRYLSLLATKTASHALVNHNDLTPTITDVRMAMQDVGAFKPQLSPMEEQAVGEEDMRGVDGFLEWLRGDGNAELRRIAGLAGLERMAVNIEAETEKEDFLTVLKKKHSKTGEESRYQGTVIGKDADEKVVKIEGGHVESIEAWEARAREHGRILKPISAPQPISASLRMLSLKYQTAFIEPLNSKH